MELNWNGKQATTLVIDRTTLATGRSYSLADLFRGISWDVMPLGSLAIMAGGDP